MPEQSDPLAPCFISARGSGCRRFSCAVKKVRFYTFVTFLVVLCVATGGVHGAETRQQLRRGGDDHDDHNHDNNKALAVIISKTPQEETPLLALDQDIRTVAAHTQSDDAVIVVEETRNLDLAPSKKKGNDEYLFGSQILHEYYMELDKVSVSDQEEQSANTAALNSSLSHAVTPFEQEDESNPIKPSFVSCSDAKSHFTVAASIVAGIATLFTGGAAIGAREVLIAGFSTIFGGLLGYVDCDESNFVADMNAIKKIAEDVWKSNTEALIRAKLTTWFRDLNVKNIFQLTPGELLIDAAIGRLIYTDSAYFDTETFGLSLIIFGSLSQIYMMTLMKIEAEGDTSGYTCTTAAELYVNSLEDIKKRMDAVNWETQSAAFETELKSERIRGEIRYSRNSYVEDYWNMCTATYKGISYSFRTATRPQVSNARDSWVSHWPYGEPTECKSNVRSQFKPKFDKWHDTIKLEWDAMIKLYNDVWKGTYRDTVEYLDDELCGIFSKPKCMPSVFEKGLPVDCCDYKFKCFNFEGPCRYNNDCKDGSTCENLDTIQLSTSDRNTVLQNAKWKLGRQTHVCYKAGAPLPGPVSKEHKITFYPTRNPTRAPVAPPSPPPPPPSPCFSSASIVNTVDRGMVPISQVKIGDSVQSSKNGSFSRVYALEHNHHSVATFYQLHSSAGVLLELTDRHMIFLKNKRYPVPAKEIHVGDVINMIDFSNNKNSTEDNGRVVRIEIIRRKGHYNPLTEDGGTIVINGGVLASSFSAAKSSSSSFFDDKTRMLHWHTLSHLANAPLRFVCKAVSFRLCSEERFQNEDGLHKYIVLLKNTGNSSTWKQMIAFPLIFGMGLFFTALDYVYNGFQASYEAISSVGGVGGAAWISFTVAAAVVMVPVVPYYTIVHNKKYLNN